MGGQSPCALPYWNRSITGNVVRFFEGYRLLMSLASIRTQGLEIFGGFHKCLEDFLEFFDLSYKLLSLKFYVRFATFALEATVTPYPFSAGQRLIFP